MPKISVPKPTDAELQLLTVLWKRGPLTVRELHQASGETTGYTTTLKQLQVMTGKGLVRRNQSQRAHVYQAALSENATQRQLISGLLARAFGGSISKLVLQALGSKKASAADLAEIKRLIEKLSQN